MDRRKVTFFFFLTVLAPSGLQLIRQKKQKTKKTKKEPTFMSTVYLCFGLARSV